MAGTAVESLIQDFRKRFPSSGNPAVFRAPGRVNLIGEHTDYNLGFVMPVALGLACYAAVAPGATGRLRAWSADLDQGFELDPGSLAEARPRQDWSDYVVGVARELLFRGYHVPPVDLVIHSTVPIGSGLSSSASLEIASALALSGGAALSDRTELAKAGKAAENNFVGLPSGIMDQFASVFGRAGRALQIDCRSLEIEEVALPGGISVIAVNSMVKHELGASAYRERVAQCAEAVRMIQRRYPEVESLRDAAPEMLEAVEGLPLKRARHIVAENLRVLAFATAARSGDVARMGQLFYESHRSLRDDYEVSCAELDFLVEAALRYSGVLGARMTGGGFGGCTVNLVVSGKEQAFQTWIADQYEGRFGTRPQCYPCDPADGAGAIS